MTEEDFAQAVANALKRRQSSITHIKQVVVEMQGTLYDTTAATMAIPLFYAHWEGFVRETLMIYLEFVEEQQILPQNANPTIFAFSLRRQLRSLSGKQTVERLTEFASSTLAMLSGPIRFSDKTIDTKSNLNFEVLEGLCLAFCIKIERLRDSKADINVLVNRRNNIAHGNKPQKMDLEDIEEYATLVSKILADFETALNEAVIKKTFTKPKKFIMVPLC